MALFEPLVVGAVTLKNRVLMAPLTRTRATLPGHVPTDIMTEHYSQRASAGLIIAEATMIQEKTSAFYAEPGIYNQEQVDGWKKVTDAVHAKGGLIYLQIWHGGRACHPSNNDGHEIVAPSAIKLTHRIGGEFNPTGQPIEAALPRALTVPEIKAIVGAFATAATNARAAGFDGVEIHGANGYLIDSFLRTSSNQRDDEYGGSLENRCRFALEVVDAVSAAVGADRVGIRLSPLNSYNDMKDEDPVALTAYLAKELSKRKIAFLHMMRADFFGVQNGDVITPARENFNGPLFVNMGYTPDEAESVVASKAVDAVVFGTKFLANPDLPERILKKAELNPPNPATFYGRDGTGYTDYSFMALN